MVESDYMFLTDYLWGIIEDNSMMLSMHYIDGKLGPFGVSDYDVLLQSTQPLIPLIFFLLGKVVDSILIWNLLIFIIFLLNIFFTNKFFKNFFYDEPLKRKILIGGFWKSRINLLFKRNTIIRFILVTLVIISPYVVYSSQNHIILFSIWILSLGLHMILNLKYSKKHILYFVSYLFFVFIYSNYYFYILIIVYTLYMITNIIFLSVKAHYKDIVSYFKLYIISLVSVIIGLLILFWVRSSLMMNIFPVRFNKYREILSFNNYSRPIEDFFTFSARPWYFFMPPKSNILFGTISIYVETNIKKIGTLYWLAQNYFEREHVALYLGFINILMVFLGIYSVHKGVIKVPKKNNQKILILTIMAMILIFMIMPPYIVIHTHKIYLLSYLLWKKFPMFRVLSRFGIVILMVFLIWVGLGYKYLMVRYGNKWVVRFIIIVFVAFSILEFNVPIIVYNMKNIPLEYKVLKENTNDNDLIAIYPNSFSKDYIFWMKYHKRTLVNPKGFIDRKYSFISDKFTKDLLTLDGLKEAKNLNVKFLLVDLRFLDEREKYRLNNIEILNPVVMSDKFILYRIGFN